jgi:anthranilate synthase/aminodeoxychorismate synthase-like glutamine amidotransferase
MPMIIIDNYDSFTFNLYQMLQANTDEKVEVYRNDKIDFQSLSKLKPSRMVLSPGPGHPAIDSDFGVCKDVILRQRELNCPILGVCLGHQGMVHHLGGKVIHAPHIVHGKASSVEITKKSKLLEGMPNVFEAMRYHSLVAADEQFPDQLEITAREGKHGLIMALEHKSAPMYGVQFHPESIGTPLGEKILRNFIERC